MTRKQKVSRPVQKFAERLGYKTGGIAKAQWEKLKKEEKAYNQAIYRYRKKLERASGLDRKALERMGFIPKRFGLAMKDVQSREQLKTYRKAMKLAVEDMKSEAKIRQVMKERLLLADDWTEKGTEMLEELMEELPVGEIADIYSQFEWDLYSKIQESLRSGDSSPFGTRKHDLEFFSAELDKAVSRFEFNTGRSMDDDRVKELKSDLRRRLKEIMKK